MDTLDIAPPIAVPLVIDILPALYILWPYLLHLPEQSSSNTWAPLVDITPLSEPKTFTFLISNVAFLEAPIA